MLKLYSTIALMLLLPFVGYSQKQVSYTAEEMEFLAQVKHTPQYQALKRTVDSINRDTTQVPQELRLIIARKQVIVDDNQNFFNASLSRLVMGMGVENYQIKYDRNKKKIISFSGSGSSAKIN